MENIGIANYFSEYAKLLVINKNVCEDHLESISCYVELMI